MDKSGCAWLVGVPLAIVFVLGLIYMGGGGRRDQAPEVPPSPAILSVGSAQINAEELEKSISAQGANMQSDLGDPLQMFQLSGMVLDNMVQDLALRELAASKGLKLTEAGLFDIWRKRFESDKAQMRLMLESEKKLKPGATEAEFLAAAKAAQPARDYEAEWKQVETELPKQLKDPLGRERVLSDTVQIGLQEIYLKDTKLTDEQLEKNYINNTYKTIFIADQKDAAENKKLAEKILGEIKAGKSFEAAMEQYIKTPAAPGKKKSDQTQDLPASLIEQNETYKPLGAMKPGEVKLMDMQGSVILYKFLGSKKTLPKDWATKKEYYRSEKAREEAFRKVMEDNKKLVDTLKIKWASPAWENFYKYYKEGGKLRTAGKSFKELKETLEPYIAKAQEAADTDQLGRNVSVYTQVAVMDQLWRSAKSEVEKKELTDERIRILNAALEVTESPQARLDLAQLYLDQKSPESIEQLLMAAQNNSGSSPLNVRIDNDVVQMLDKIKAAKLGTAEQYKQIEEEHQRWMKERQAELQAQAEAQRERDAEQKAAEEEMKKEKAAADAAKKAEQPFEKGSNTQPPSNKPPTQKPPENKPPSGTPNPNNKK